MASFVRYQLRLPVSAYLIVTNLLRFILSRHCPPFCVYYYPHPRLFLR
ncbi:hypothetical protein CI610_02915 [invertebrate metagenome]|uniref:Uncharacterized protein n=1 Tax=invertebrate metagenome TaxID=1711999 RepID=A0A2H9T4K3_9ZZZZ